MFTVRSSTTRDRILPMYIKSPIGPAQKKHQKNAAIGWNDITDYSFIGLAIDSPSRIDSEILPNMYSNTALPEVSRVMLRASRIGTPLETSVPSVRVVRAR